MSDNRFDNIDLGLEAIAKNVEQYRDASKQLVENIIQPMVEF